MQKIFKKVRQFFISKNHKYINGPKGVISIFLACLMVPFAYIADVLIESGRYNSSLSMLDQSINTAQTSTLADYDEYLLERFGMLAVSQQTDIETLFKGYYGDVIANMSTSMDVDFSTIEGKLPLTDKNVFLRQVGEAGKYTIPSYFAGTTLSELIEKLEGLGNLSQILDITSAAGDAANSGVQLVDATNKLRKCAKNLQSNNTKYQDKHTSFKNALNNLKSQCSDVEKKLSEYNSKKESASQKISNALSAQKVYEAAKDKINEYKNALNTLKDSGVSDKDIKTISNFIDDIIKYPRQTYRIDILADYINDNKLSGDIKLSAKETTELKNLAKAIRDLKLSEKQKSAHSLSDETISASSEATKAKKAYEAEEAKLSSYRDAVRTAKKEYVDAINPLISGDNSLKRFSELYKDVLEKRDSFFSTVESSTNTIVKNTTELTDKKLKSAEDDKDKLEKEIKKLEKDKDANKEKIETANDRLKKTKSEIDDIKAKIKNKSTALKDAQKLQEEIIDGSSDLFSKTYDTLASRAAAALQEIKSYLNDSSRFNVDDIKSSTSISNTQISIYKTETYYKDITNTFATESIINQFKDQINTKLSGGKGIREKIKAIISTIQEMIKASGIYNPKLKAMVSSDATITNSELDNVLSHLAKFMDAISDLGGFDFWNYIKKIYDVLHEGKEFIKSVIRYAGELFENLRESFLDIAEGRIGERALLAQYAVMSCPDRTTYDSESCKITGMKYSKAALKEPSNDPLSIIGGISDVINLYKTYLNESGTDTVFSGAELEYILFGSRSEIVNQVGAFFQIFVLRLLCNIPGVLTNGFIDTLAGAFSWSVVGPVIIYLVYILEEAYTDTTLLVAGADVPLVKLSCDIYLTPEGIGDLISTVASVSISTATKDKLIEHGKTIIGKDVYPSEAKVKKSTAKKIISLFDFDYTSYMFLFIMLENSSETTMKRLQNLMQLETNEYYKLKGYEIERFKLEKAYTYLDVNASATFSPILPLEPVSQSAFKRISTIQSRGY